MREAVLRLIWRDVAPNYLGDPNELENSEDCRGAGGHGNQHVRLRSAQIDCIETICPALAATCCFEPWQASCSPLQESRDTVLVPSSFFCIEKVEVRSAIGEVCKISRRGPGVVIGCGLDQRYGHVPFIPRTRGM